MNQTCDRCGPAVQAAYRVARNGELYLCRRCINRLGTALTAQGWAIWPTDQQVVVRKPARSLPG